MYDAILQHTILSSISRIILGVVSYPGIFEWSAKFRVLVIMLLSFKFTAVIKLSFKS